MTSVAETEASAEVAYRAILAQVQSGALKPGDRIPEGQIATTLGVSRTPVREALRRLSAEGIVDLALNQGARVANWDEEDLKEVFDLRLVLEGFAAALAARKATAEDVARLREIEREFEQVVKQEKPNFREESARLNNLFHLEILRITGNKRLIGLLSQLVSVPLKRGSFQSYSRRDFDYAIRQHRELIHAFATNDEVAAELGIMLHINSSRAAIMNAVSEKKSAPPKRKVRLVSQRAKKA